MISPVFLRIEVYALVNKMKKKDGESELNEWPWDETVDENPNGTLSRNDIPRWSLATVAIFLRTRPESTSGS
jgi:hypothetical protein